MVEVTAIRTGARPRGHGARGAINGLWQSARNTARRAKAIAALIDLADVTLDDIAQRRQSAQLIAASGIELTASAAGIDTDVENIAFRNRH